MNIAFFVHSLISDWNHGNAHFLRGICSELIARGHQLKVYEPFDAWSVVQLIKSEGPLHLKEFQRAYPNLSSIRYRAINPAEALRGIDLAIAHEWNEPELINSLSQYCRKQSNPILFFHDTHHRAVSDPIFFDRLDLSGFDGVLAYGEALAKVYRDRGQRVWVWHEAADVRVFYPRPFSGNKGDVIWIGNWGDEERTDEITEFLLAPVQKLGVETEVFGVRYPSETRVRLAKAGIRYGGWLPNYEVPVQFSRFKCTVHIPRRPYVRRLAGIPTIRPFEALACGIPLISAPWDDTEGLFEPGRDFLMASTGEAMMAHLSNLLERPELAASLAQNGLRTIRAKHTCGHRVDQLLGIVADIQRGRASNRRALTGKKIAFRSG